MNCARHRDYHSLGLTHIQFHPPKVTPLTNLAKVTDQRLCYCNSDAWGWCSDRYDALQCCAIANYYCMVIIQDLR